MNKMKMFNPMKIVKEMNGTMLNNTFTKTNQQQRMKNNRSEEQIFIQHTKSAKKNLYSTMALLHQPTVSKRSHKPSTFQQLYFNKNLNKIIFMNENKNSDCRCFNGAFPIKILYNFWTHYNWYVSWHTETQLMQKK